MLGVDGQQVHMVLAHQLEDELTGHDECLLVGQADLLVGLDGVDGGLETGEAHHGGEHHVDGRSLDHLVERLLARVDLDVGTVGEERLQRFVVGVVGDDHGGGVEAVGLLGQLLHAVVGRQAVHFIAVGVLTDDVERLGADGTGAAQDAYLLFLHFGKMEWWVVRTQVVYYNIKADPSWR